jgi:hypothetical protein
MLRALKLQGVAEKTVDADARAVRRTAAFFDRGPDDGGLTIIGTLSDAKSSILLDTHELASINSSA